MGNIPTQQNLYEFMQKQGHKAFDLAFPVKDLDYTPASLEPFEKEVWNTFGEGRMKLNTTLIPLGYYFGEVLVRNIKGAEWKLSNDPKDNIMDAVIEVEVPAENGEKQKLHARPYRRIQKFLEDPTDDLSGMYRTMYLLASVGPEALSKMTPDKDGWVHLPTGDSIRMRKPEPGELGEE